MKVAWQEWTTGLPGSPSVQSLDQLYGSKWRTSPADRKWYSSRKVLVDAVAVLSSREALSEDEAVSELDRLRAGKSLDSLRKLVKTSNRFQPIDIISGTVRQCINERTDIPDYPDTHDASLIKRRRR